VDVNSIVGLESGVGCGAGVCDGPTLHVGLFLLVFRAGWSVGVFLLGSKRLVLVKQAVELTRHTPPRTVAGWRKRRRSGYQCISERIMFRRNRFR
jgi:hypothetical protein